MIEKFRGFCDAARLRWPQLRDVECCSSCHNDYDDGYAEPLFRGR